MNKKVIIGIFIVLIACCGVYASLTDFTKGLINEEISTPNVDISSLEIKENLVTADSMTTDKKLYTTDKKDVNTILVENNSTLTLSDSAVNKTGDSSDNGDNVDFYGTNSAILVKKGSIANIEKTVINTNSRGSNAVFVTNSEPNDEQITTEPDNMQNTSPNIEQSPENGGSGGMSGQGSVNLQVCPLKEMEEIIIQVGVMKIIQVVVLPLMLKMLKLIHITTSQEVLMPHMVEKLMQRM